MARQSSRLVAATVLYYAGLALCLVAGLALAQRRAGSIDAVFAILGVGLIAAGIWVSTPPRPRGRADTSA